MRLLSRYVIREHVGPLVFALSALTSLLLLNYIAKQFGNLVGKGLPWTVIAEFFVLSVPFTLAMTLPMAVLVSTLYAFSRLAAENEVTALKASGVSLRAILFPVLGAGAVVAAGMVFFNDQVLPRANARLSTLQGDIARKKPTFAIREQVINEVSPGRLYLRANHVDPASNRLREVTIWDLGDPAHRRTIRADSGSMAIVDGVGGADLAMTLHDGAMEELAQGKPGQLQRLFFSTNVVRVAEVGNQLERSEGGGYRGDREMTICEMEREIARLATMRDEARRRWERSLVTAVRVASGVRAVVPEDRAPHRRWTLGALYCRVLGGAVPAAQAQMPGAPKPRTAPPPPVVPETPMAATPAALTDTAADPVARYTALVAIAEGARQEAQAHLQSVNGYDVEIEKKFALSVACVVFVLFGAPIALRFPRGGVGLVIGVSLGVFGLYYVGLIAGEALANRGILSPFWAMWATNVIFTLLGLVLVLRLGKEGATARGGDFGELLEGIRERFRRGRGSLAAEGR